MRDENQTFADGVSCEEHVEIANWLASSFEVGANHSVGVSGSGVEINNLNLHQKLAELVVVGFRLEALVRPKSKFGDGDCRNANFVVSALLKSLSDAERLAAQHENTSEFQRVKGLQLENWYE